jgi:hypothetical protein
VSEWDPGRTRRELEAAGFDILRTRNLPGSLWALSLHHLCVGVKSGEGTPGPPA